MKSKDFKKYFMRPEGFVDVATCIDEHGKTWFVGEKYCVCLGLLSANVFLDDGASLASSYCVVGDIPDYPLSSLATLTELRRVDRKIEARCALVAAGKEKP